MAKTVFKRLVEVQILQEYFLFDESGNTIFGLNLAGQTDLLRAKLTTHQYNVKKEFLIQPTIDTRRLLNAFKLKYANTGLGFIIGTEVEVIETAPGNISYKPMSKWFPEARLQFILQNKNSHFNGTTNSRINNTTPSIYLFSNTGKTPVNNILSLSSPLANVATDHQYEMGELANFNGSPRMAVENTDGATLSNWINITDHQYVNEVDKILLPKQFIYRFFNQNNIKQARFSLIKKDGTILKSIEKKQSDAFNMVSLNFKNQTGNSNNPTAIPAGHYTLEINTDTGFSSQKKVFLNDELYQKNYLGIIDIGLNDLHPDYELLDPQGQLKTRLVNGNKVLHPKYEIRFQSRNSFWRYIKQSDFSISEITRTNSFLNQVSNKVLISKTPKKSSHSLVPFVNGGTTILPMPKLNSLKFSKDKIYSDIFISKTNKIFTN